MSTERHVSGKEAVRVMRAGGECKRSVLVYFLQDGVLVFRDRKGVVHKSHGTIDKLANEAALQDDWIVVREPNPFPVSGV